MSDRHIQRYRTFLLANLLLLAISGLLLLWMSREGSIDFWITAHFFDHTHNLFPFRDSILLESLGHVFLKNLTGFFLIVGIALSIASYRIAGLRHLRRALISFCIMASLSALFISILISVSVHACPWDLQMYGGSAPWLPLFGQLMAGVNPGHCWPGGHASGGFALVAGYFSFREYRRKWARAFLMTGLLLGSLMGFVQMLKGAHFLSHNLWTLWIVWAFCLALDAASHYFFAHRKTRINTNLLQAVDL